MIYDATNMVLLNPQSTAKVLALLMQSPILSMDTPQAMKEDVGQGQNGICNVVG